VTWSICSFILYFVFEMIFIYDSVLTVIVPQFVYHFECLVTCFLLQYTNFRLSKLSKQLATTCKSTPGGSRRGQRMETTTQKFDTYIYLNNFLTISVFMDFIGLFIINMDLLINYGGNHSSPALQNHLFVTDFLTKIFNVGFSGTYFIVILIFFPWDVSRHGTSVVQENSSGYESSAGGCPDDLPERSTTSHVRHLTPQIDASLIEQVTSDHLKLPQKDPKRHSSTIPLGNGGKKSEGTELGQYPSFSMAICEGKTSSPFPQFRSSLDSSVDQEQTKLVEETSFVIQSTGDTWGA